MLLSKIFKRLNNQRQEITIYQDMEEDSLSFIPTKGSALKKKNNNEFQVVSFQSYKSKRQKEQVRKLPELPNSNLQREFNIRQAKHEIIKFGMSGFDPQKKEQAKVQLAIKLGAKPPKNKYKNYKLLQAEKKKEKEAETSRLQFQQLGKNKLGKSNAKGKSFDRKRRKEKGDILDVYGKVKASVQST